MMATQTKNITINQGSTYTLILLWQTLAGVPINITSYSGDMQVRENIDDTATLMQASTANGKMVIDGAAGKVTVTIPKTETTLLDFTRAVYDLEVTSPGSVTTRLIQGDVKLSEEVTR